MILSKSKVEELLKIFESSKSLSPYDNSREKEEMKNASEFIKNYRTYGPPPKQTLNAINGNYNNNSILKSQSKKFRNLHEMEIQRSLTNLKLGKENYMKEQKTNWLNII